jgi:hypothetical protein
MDIQWFRDLTIVVFGCVSIVVLIVAAILSIRLYRIATFALGELKEASMLARDTAERVHDGIKPMFALLAMIQGIREGYERSGGARRKYRR